MIFTIKTTAVYTEAFRGATLLAIYSLSSGADVYLGRGTRQTPNCRSYWSCEALIGLPHKNAICLEALTRSTVNHFSSSKSRKHITISQDLLNIPFGTAISPVLVKWFWAIATRSFALTVVGSKEYRRKFKTSVFEVSLLLLISLKMFLSSFHSMTGLSLFAWNSPP